ncbi:MAG: malonic semialdehyde reductase [Ferrovum sp.]|nr:malonic semialdehyde reductase [Ferrovum sp.]NDU86734.1 malonic semialdehyde reductase [Ferrovum sp.]
MGTRLDDTVLDQLFSAARTAHAFTDQPLPAGTLQKLYELACWGPTAFNAQPARFVFVQSEAGKSQLIPSLSPGNVAQVKAAPLTVIVAYDQRFHEFLPRVFKGYDAKPLYDNAPELIESTAFRNSTLQGAYLLMAARALGLAVGPMSGFNAAVLEQEFFPDGRYRANFLMNIGYPAASGNLPRNERLRFDEAVTVI